MKIYDLPTPSILIDVDRMEGNIRRMQNVCTEHGVQLWPHIKTHKCVEILKRQLAAGAAGITCAKIGEAEAMLPSGVKRIFVAHSIVAPEAGPRLRALQENLDQLLVAVTSKAQAEHLEKVIAGAGIKVDVMMAYDTGLGREGARSIEQIKEMRDYVEASPHFELKGVYSHEGHCYRSTPETMNEVIDSVYTTLREVMDALDRDILLAPGCSVSAARMATKPGVNWVRPGAYPLGDLSLAYRLSLMPWESAAATVYTTVVDRPTDDLALIDAGSKTFSGDKTADGTSGRCRDNVEMAVQGVNEEHGYVRGPEATPLKIGERLQFVPAHVCGMINMHDQVYAVRGDEVLDTWKIEGRGKIF